ncbi:MAG: hypothetical protein KJZ78_10380, partial [Bryobacteraceae bacterium]|nr:hypothetical protein [Bryobacteraceae bacterium]
IRPRMLAPVPNDWYAFSAREKRRDSPYQRHTLAGLRIIVLGRLHLERVGLWLVKDTSSAVGGTTSPIDT